MATGSSRDAAVAPAADRTVDLAGGQLIHGFVDAHNHLASMALTKLGVNPAGLKGKDAILANVREWVQASRPTLLGADMDASPTSSSRSRPDANGSKRLPATDL